MAEDLPPRGLPDAAPQFPVDGEPIPPLWDEPPAAPSPFAAWFARLGTHGKLIVFGSIGGVVCSFLPVAVMFFGHTILMIDRAEGGLCLLGYIGCVVLSFFAYQSRANSGLTVALLATAGSVALLAVVAFLRYSSYGGAGVYLNVAAAGVTASGAFLKAKRDRLF